MQYTVKSEGFSESFIFEVKIVARCPRCQKNMTILGNEVGYYCARCTIRAHCEPNHIWKEEHRILMGTVNQIEIHHKVGKKRPPKKIVKDE